MLTLIFKQSLVSIHKDVTSTDSLPKKGKKEKKNAARKKRELVLGDDTALDKQNIAGSQGDGGLLYFHLLQILWFSLI